MARLVNKPLRQLTHTELVENFMLCDKADEDRIKAEIARRINAKNTMPCPADCLCTDCQIGTGGDQ